MAPGTAALINTLIEVVGIPAVRLIAARVREQGHPDVADALTEAALQRSDATLDDVAATARREQGRS